MVKKVLKIYLPKNKIIAEITMTLSQDKDEFKKEQYRITFLIKNCTSYNVFSNNIIWN